MEQLCGLDDHHILLRNAINKNDELGNCGLELQTKVKRNEDFSITEKAPTKASLHLRHYAEQALTDGK